MQAPPSDPALEIKRLQSCMNDLVSVLALPVVWRGREPAEILSTFVDSLMAMLNLDFFYARVTVEGDERPIEALRVGPTCLTSEASDQTAQLIAEWLKEKQFEQPSPARRQIGSREIAFLPMRIGVEGELGFVVIGSHRASFPEQTEQLIMSVASNQAAIGIQQAQRLNEEKRVSQELDERVAQRTAELAAANDVLRKEIAERKEIEERLRESEAFLLDAQHLSHTGSWKHELVSNKVIGTPEIERIYEITAQEDRSSPEFFFNRIHPDDRDRERKVYSLALNEKRDFESDYRIVLPDGSIKHIHNIGRPRLNEEGEVVDFLGTAIDLTEQHKIQADLQKAHAEIKRSEAKLWRVIDTIPIIAWCNLPDGPNEFLNKRWTEYTGMPFEESHGWGWTVAMHPEDLQVLMKKWQAAMITGQPNEVEGRFRRYDGVYRWFLIRTEPFRDESGRIVRWFGTSTDIDERKRAEETLQDEERGLRLIVDTIPGLVCTLKPNWEVEHINQPLRGYFGMTTEELTNWEFIGVVHPDDLDRVVARCRHCTETGEPYDIEHRCRRWDGVFRWFQIRAMPLHDDGNRIVRWYLLLTDIEDRKRAEEAVLASERNLSLIINTMPVIAWSARPDGNVDFFNQRWLDYTGLTQSEAHDWGWATAFHPDDLGRVNDYWRSHILSGEPGEMETRIRKGDGSYRWFLVRGEVLRDESGTIMKWYGTNTDIEDRKRAEEELLRKEEFLAKAQSVSATGSFAWCAETDEITISDEASRIFGFDPDVSVTSAMIASRVHPDDMALLTERRAAARNFSEAQDYEIRLLMPDGSVKYLQSTSDMVREVNGRREYIGAIQDVTQRRHIQEALNKAQTELAHVSRIMSLNALAASIAHEINQPLSGIVTNAGTCLRMLNTNPPSIEGARETVRRTIRDANRASDVITRLRSLFSRKEVSTEPVHINEIAREVLALLLSELQQNRVVLRSEFADGLPRVKADRVQIQQVILNLLRNASDAMSSVDDRPRQLLLKTELDREHVRVSVQDSGGGFDATVADRLFESFYTTKPDGMGIGLSVSRSIIEAHGGRLWATVNDGPGATFAFSIPCEHTRY